MNEPGRYALPFRESEAQTFRHRHGEGLALTADALRWDTAEREAGTDLGGIASIHLHAPAPGEDWAPSCDIRLADGTRLTVSAWREGAPPAVGRGAAYRAFLLDLHRRLDEGERGGNVEFRRDPSTRSRGWLMIAATVFGVLGMVAGLIGFVVTFEPKLLGMVFGGGGLIAWAVGGGESEPKAYRPDRVPDAMLPSP